MGALSGMMGGAGAPPGGNGGMDLQALQSMLGGFGMGTPAIQPVANPEEAYASQLTQLQVEAACLTACLLRSTAGLLLDHVL